jgi:hypothetical protein
LEVPESVQIGVCRLTMVGGDACQASNPISIIDAREETKP